MYKFRFIIVSSLLTILFFCFLIFQPTRAAEVFSPDAIIDNLQVASGKSYILDNGCGVGDVYYIDRSYKFTNFSQSNYSGLPCIKTANDDKDYQTRSFITFTLNFPATIYLYMDRRMTSPPDWMQGLFTKNDKFVEVDDPDMERFDVFSCKSIAGEIVLGGLSAPGSAGAKSMYVIAFRAEQEGRQLCSVNAPPTPTFTNTPSPTATDTSTPTLTSTFTQLPTDTSTASETATVTQTATSTPTPSFTPTNTPTPSATATHPPESGRALVLLYAALDNNLQTNWTQLVNNIEAGVTEATDVRLYVDGPTSNDAYIYDIRSDHTVNCPKLNNITCGGNYIVGTNLFVASEDSAAQMTLANFISQSVTLHPDASQLVVGLIGHGSGWSAGVLPGESQIILDQPRPWNDQPRPWNDQPGALLWDDHPSPGPTKSHSLSIKALDNAFYWAQQVTGRQIDLLYMDGCSLGMVEIAYEVRNHAHYMLASPNTDWTSFGYDKLLSAVNPKILNPLELGREWLRIDASVIRNGSNSYPYTYALVNLSKMESLKAAVNDLATRLTDQVPVNKGKISLAFSQADRFESDYNGLINEDDAYSDLKSFAIEIKSAFQTDSAMRQSANNVIDTISQAVVDKDHQSGRPPISDDYWGWDNYGGLGIYLPLVYDEERRSLYNQSEIMWLYENKWAEFLDTYLGQQTMASQTELERRPLLRCETTTDEQCNELAEPLSLPQINYLPLVSK